MAYEDGSVSLQVRSTEIIEKSAEGKGWDRLWTVKLHGESSKRTCHIIQCTVVDADQRNSVVMAMAVKRDNTAAFTVSADHLLCRYNLEVFSFLPYHSTVLTHAFLLYRTEKPG